MPKLNAVDAISPAINLTKTNLFQPFRWGFWVRIAILGLFAGEMSSGGGCNFNVPANWNQRRHDDLITSFNATPHFDPHWLLAMLPLIIAAIVILGLIFMYINSVCRFSLLEAVLNGQVSLRDSWFHWQKQGIRYFVFQLLINLAMLVVIGAVALVVIAVVGISTLQKSGIAAASAIVTIILALLALFILMMPFLVVQVLAKDFAVPVMALEGATFGTAWSRVWAMVRAEFWSVAGYIGMKIVLRIAAAIIFAIFTIIALLIIAIPSAIIGVMAFFAGKAIGLGMGPFALTLIIGAGTVLVLIIIFVAALIHAPVANFFPAYALYFFAGRYAPLHDRLFPPPPAPPAPEAPPEPPPAPPAPETPPEFLPT